MIILKLKLNYNNNRDNYRQVYKDLAFCENPLEREHEVLTTSSHWWDLSPSMEMRTTKPFMRIFLNKRFVIPFKLFLVYLLSSCFSISFICVFKL